VITQKEIAARLAVSQTLVSRVLSGTAPAIGVAPATISRIRQAAARAGYRPNAAALSLRGGPSRTVGMVIRNFEDPFLGHVLGTLQELARERGYALLLTGDGTGATRPDLAVLLQYRVDGLIIIGSDFVPVGLAAFLRQSVPVVMIGAGAPVKGVTRVAADEAGGVRKLVHYLCTAGHRRIGLLGNRTHSNQRRKRWAEQELRRKKLPFRPEWFVTPASDAAEAGYVGMRHLLALPPDRRPTAIIALEDVMAQTALRAVFEAGLQVPRDLSMVSIDDIPAAARMIPALTTLRLPIREMAQAAFDLLLQPHPRSHRLLPPTLQTRESCGTIAAVREAEL